MNRRRDLNRGEWDGRGGAGSDIHRMMERIMEWIDIEGSGKEDEVAGSDINRMME